MEEKVLFGRTVDGGIVELVAASHDIVHLIRDGDEVKVQVESRNMWGDEIVGSSDPFEFYSDEHEYLKADICYIEAGYTTWVKKENGEWY